MPNLKFGLTNLLTQPGVILKNGTGGGAPALIESAPYVMANLLLGDRWTLWKPPGLAIGSYNVDFDLGGNKAINAAGFHGFRPIGVAGPSIDVSYQTGTYNGAGSWTFLDTMVGARLNLRDDGLECGQVTARSVRFTINIVANGATFTLGKFFVGSLTDMGAKHSPGTTYSPMGNRTETELIGGAIVLAELGDEGAEFRLLWLVASPTVEGI